jgi:hypothetical protein
MNLLSGLWNFHVHNLLNSGPKCGTLAGRRVVSLFSLIPLYIEQGGWAVQHKHFAPHNSGGASQLRIVEKEKAPQP